MSATDILDTFEGSYGEYKSSTAQAWTRDYPADRFFNEIYDAPTAADMENAVSESQKQNVGWVYVTNQVLPNPYATLPSYWRDEVATVADDGTTTSRSSSHRRR